MAEGKKQRKFGRNGRSSSSKLQVARTAANKAKRLKASALTTDKYMEVPRGVTRALRRAVKFLGKQQAEVLENVPIRCVVSTIGEKQAIRLLGRVW